MSDRTRAQQRLGSVDNEVSTARAPSHRSAGMMYSRTQPYGNQAALRSAFGSLVQPKLRVSSPGDDLEREADAATDAVMRAPEHATPSSAATQLSRLPSGPPAARQQDEANEKDEEELPVHRMPAGGDLTAPTTETEDEDEEEIVQPKRASGSEREVSSDVTSQISSSRGGGSALPPQTRQYFEPRFGRDLSSVRVHDDAQAASAARQLDAHAFTAGSDIYFASGRYQPASTEGQSLLAHELAHTIQQQPGAVRDGGSASLVARQAATEAGAKTLGAAAGPPPVAAAGPKLPDDVPAEEVEMMGAGTFTPSAPVADYIKGKGRKGGPVRVRFGSLAAGAISVAETKDGYKTPGEGEKLQSVALTHPFLEPLRERGIVQPVLAVRMRKSEITGYLTIASAKGVPLDYQAIGDVLEKHADALGWLGLDDVRLPNITNKLESGTLNFKVPKLSFRVGGFLRATGEIGLVNEAVTFAASADIKIKKGVAEGKFNVERDKTGLLFGKAELPVTFKNFSGSFIVELANGTFRFDGLVRYTSEKFSGEVKVIVTDEAEARNIARTKLPPEKILASAEEAKGKPAAGKGPKPGPRAVAGWGTLTFRFTDWLAGQATVIIDSEGHITVVGEIAPPAEVQLFPPPHQKNYTKPLPKFEARAAYGIPVVGNLFVFASVEFAALAKLGPAKIYNIKIAGTYSTDPAVLQDFSIEGTLNISAFAGLRARGEGGVGIEILSHDLKAGVGLEALAGIKGYVEATPKIGYREKADPDAGKKGEAYLHGHIELAARPFLGLSGDLFVSISTPWWSPLSDKRWTWPLGELEYALPGEFGIGADIDYLLGSDKLPEIQFGEVDFNADKFMTDLMNDEVPPKKVGDEEKKGEWSEGVKGTGAQDPALTDSQGKPPEGEAATGQLTPGEAEQVPSPEIRDRFASGTKALAELQKASEADALSRAELDLALADLKSAYGFTALTTKRSGDKWLVHAVMNPYTDEEIAAEHEAQTGEEQHVIPPPGVVPEDTQQEITRLPVHDHHLLPEQYRARFRALGIAIDRYTITIDESHHLGVVHGYNRNGYNEWERNWNGIWGAFFRDHDAAGVEITRMDVYQQLAQMLAQFNLDAFDVHHYGRVTAVTSLQEIAE